MASPLIDDVGVHRCSNPAPAGRRSNAIHRSAPRWTVIETTEFRWFQHGTLPPAVSWWFTQHGTLGVVEQRCDLYRMDGRIDVGVKLRARSTLELKVRQSMTSSALSTDEPHGVVEPPQGAVEVWRKWSPADELVGDGPEPRLEVHKKIVKRRFAITGEKIAVADLAGPPGHSFCDVELVAIDDGSTEAWSFAFAAQGPRRSRHAGMQAAWRALMSMAPPSAWPSAFTTSCGYPEWLGQRTTDRPPVTER